MSLISAYSKVDGLLLKFSPKWWVWLHKESHRIHYSTSTDYSDPESPVLYHEYSLRHCGNELQIHNSDHQDGCTCDSTTLFINDESKMEFSEFSAINQKEFKKLYAIHEMLIDSQQESVKNREELLNGSLEKDPVKWVKMFFREYPGALIKKLRNGKYEVEFEKDGITYKLNSGFKNGGLDHCEISWLRKQTKIFETNSDTAVCKEVESMRIRDIMRNRRFSQGFKRWVFNKKEKQY